MKIVQKKTRTSRREKKKEKAKYTEREKERESEMGHTACNRDRHWANESWPGSDSAARARAPAFTYLISKEAHIVCGPGLKVD